MLSARSPLCRSSGFTMLEVLAVVGITAFAFVGLLHFSSMVQTKNLTASTNQLLTAISEEAVAYHKIKGTYADINCDTVDDPSCYFVQKKIVAQSQKNPFGGGISMVSMGDSMMKIALRNITKSACVELVQDAVERKQLTQMELMDPNQEIVNSATGPSCNLAVHPGTTTPMLQNNYATMTSCVDKSGSTYNVVTVHRFPVPVSDAALLCDIMPRYTITWTFD